MSSPLKNKDFTNQSISLKYETRQIYTWIPWKVVIPSCFISWKTFFFSDISRKQGWAAFSHVENSGGKFRNFPAWQNLWKWQNLACSGEIYKNIFSHFKILSWQLSFTRLRFLPNMLKWWIDEWESYITVEQFSAS